MRYLSFQIVRNDIVKMNVDAIVNTANPKPVYGFGIDSAVYEAAGKDELLKIHLRHHQEQNVIPCTLLGIFHIILQDYNPQNEYAY